MSETTSHGHPRKPALVDAAAMRSALRDSFLKLSPRHLLKSPVMAIVMVGTLLSAVITLAGVATPGFGGSVTLILLVTVLFGNFAEAIAEARGRGQAETAGGQPRGGLPRRARHAAIGAGAGIFRAGFAGHAVSGLGLPAL